MKKNKLFKEEKFQVQNRYQLKEENKLFKLQNRYQLQEENKFLDLNIVTRKEIVWKRRNFFCLCSVPNLTRAQSFRKGTKSSGKFQ